MSSFLLLIHIIGTPFPNCGKVEAWNSTADLFFLIETLKNWQEGLIDK
jgi:hypothetical protein